MKKPKYSREEISELRDKLKDLDTLNYDEALVTTKQSITDYLEFAGTAEIRLDAFQSIAHEAYVLEQQAKELRQIVQAFQKPLTEIPKKINDENPVIATVAQWRLSIGH